jgi:hypothetical protein
MAEDFKTGNTYVSPEDKAMGVYSSANLPETVPTGIYAPQISEQQRLSDNFQSSELLRNTAQDINNPSPLLYSAVDGTTPISTSPLIPLMDTIKNPVGNIMQPILDKATVEKKAPLTPAEEHVAMGQQVSVPAQQSAQPIEQPPVTQTAISGIVNPFAGSNATAMKGINQAEQAGQLKAVAEHAYYQKKADAEQEAMDKQQKLQETFDFNYQEKMDEYTQSIKDFRALAGDKVVPGAFLARQDTQGSIMTGLAIALGGIGGALQGTNKNIGLEMIEKAIDKDVAAQQFNMQYKYNVSKANVDDQASLLSKMREKFGDDKSAILATKLGMLSMVQDKMNAEMTKQGGATDLAVKSQANAARAQIMQRREQYEMQLKAAQAQAFEKQQMLVGKDKNNLSPEDALTVYGDKLAPQYVSGFGLARSTEDKKKFQEEYGDSKNSLDALKTVINSDINKLSPDDRARLGTELSLLTGKMRLAVLGPGAMTEAEYERLRETLGDPTKIVTFPGTQMLKLKTVLNRLQKAQDNAVTLYFGREKAQELKNSSNNVDSLVKKD